MAQLKIGDIVASVANERENSVKCDGREVLISEHEELYAIIGNTFGGSGLGFNVPDLRGCFLLGAFNAADMNFTEGISHVRYGNEVVHNSEYVDNVAQRQKPGQLMYNGQLRAAAHHLNYFIIANE